MVARGMRDDPMRGLRVGQGEHGVAGSARLEGAGGQQSASIALLDAGRSGVILTAIQGRDYARIYVKELDHGRPSVALSPEEEQAVERAMAG